MFTNEMPPGCKSLFLEKYVRDEETLVVLVSAVRGVQQSLRGVGPDFLLQASGAWLEALEGPSREGDG
ncbi:hypothetical protein DRW03_33230 [Corallococcus sp. H22C18031201]|nr:hypothetical protein DRW03_33230 [Corallococcus sp. H22C18031201]